MMHGDKHRPHDVLRIAGDVVMHGTCNMAPVCVYIEAVFENENGQSVVCGHVRGPTHAVIGGATDPVSVLDFDRLSELFYPEQVESSPDSNSDGSGEVGVEDDDE